MGYAAHRARLLRASGFKVIEVPYEMHVSGKTPFGRAEYLRDVLRPYLDMKSKDRFQGLQDDLD